MSGLTKSGFSRKLFNEIKSEQENALTRSLGELNFNAPSIIAQLVAIFAEREAVLWEAVEAVYNSSYPDTAEGQSLDGVCALTGVRRLDATYSKAICQLRGINQTTIPEDSLVLVKNTDNAFAIDEEITINNENCYSIALEVTDNTLPSYGLTINGTMYEHEKIATDFVSDIANALITQINEADINLTAMSQEGYITITSKLEQQTFSCFVSEQIEILDCTNNAAFTAVKAGVIDVPASSLSVIQTPVQGWISATNIEAGKTGRNLETDIELRQRRSQSLALSGSGTFEAMLARLRNVSGVTTVSIRENATDETDSNNIPPRSFEVLALGGEDEQIGQVIWTAKPISIASHGNTDIVIKDSTNQEQLVKFSRPTKSYIFAKITLTTNDAFLPNGIGREAIILEMKKNIVSQITALPLGGTVVYQSLYGQVYSFDGINQARITIGKSANENDAPMLKEENVVLEISEQAVTDTGKITVEVA